MAQVIGSNWFCQQNWAPVSKDGRFQIVRIHRVLCQPNSCHWKEWKCYQIDSSRYYRAGGSDRQSCTGTATPAAEVQACVGRQLSSSLTLSAHTLVGETRASLTLYTLNTRSLWFEALGCSSVLRRRSLPIWKANRPTLELVKSHTQTLRFCCVSLNLNALKQNVAQELDLFSRKTDRGREREKKREIEAEKDGERETRVKNRHITMPEKNQNIFQRKMGHFQILVPYQTN